MKKKPEEPVCR